MVWSPKTKVIRTFMNVVFEKSISKANITFYVNNTDDLWRLCKETKLIAMTLWKKCSVYNLDTLFDKFQTKNVNGKFDQSQQNWVPIECTFIWWNVVIFFCWAKFPHTQTGLSSVTCKSIDGSLSLNCIQIKTNLWKCPP